jgi:riboflavin kinase/FMN adenylyltransferase
MPDGTKRGGMLCIGHRPTIESNGELSIEVHIFDFNGNLYGKQICLDFIGNLREERHFASLEELQQQLTIDAAAAREMISHSA